MLLFCPRIDAITNIGSVSQNWQKITIRWLYAEVVMLTIAVFVVVTVSAIRPPGSYFNLNIVTAVLVIPPFLIWIGLLFYFGLKLLRTLKGEFDFSTARRQLIRKNAAIITTLLLGIFFEVFTIGLLSSGIMLKSKEQVQPTLFADIVLQPLGVLVMYVSVLYFLKVSEEESAKTPAREVHSESLHDQDHHLRSTSYRIMEDPQDDEL